MTIINEDWEHIFQHQAMYSIEEQMSREEDYWNWLEHENQLPALIEVQIFNTSPIYEYTRIRE